MKHKISEEKFLSVINLWMEFEFPSSFSHIITFNHKNIVVYKDENYDTTFMYYYKDDTKSLDGHKKYHLIVGIDIDEKFSDIFGNDNLIFLGKWFELKTNKPVKSIS